MFNEHDKIYDVRLHIIIKFIDSFFVPCHKNAYFHSGMDFFIIRIRLQNPLPEKFGQKFFRRLKTLQI